MVCFWHGYLLKWYLKLHILLQNVAQMQVFLAKMADIVFECNSWEAKKLTPTKTDQSLVTLTKTTQSLLAQQELQTSNLIGYWNFTKTTHVRIYSNYMKKLLFYTALISVEQQESPKCSTQLWVIKLANNIPRWVLFGHCFLTKTPALRSDFAKNRNWGFYPSHSGNELILPFLKYFFLW